MSQNLRTTTTMRLGSLLLSTALAACTVGPDYSTPKTEWRRSTVSGVPPPPVQGRRDRRR